jgi:hypothetical protein
MGFLVLSLSKWALLTFIMDFCRLSNCYVVLRALIGVLIEGAEEFGTGTSRREFWRLLLASLGQARDVLLQVSQ